MATNSQLTVHRDERQTQTPWQVWLGPCLLVLVAASFAVFSLPNTVLFPLLLLLVTFSVFQGGLRSGVVSAILAVLFIGYRYSLPEEPFRYDQYGLSQMVSWVSAILASALLVDLLRRRDAYQVKRTARSQKDLDFRAIFENSATGAALLDPLTQRFRRVNPKFCEMTGYTASELNEKTMSDIVHPDDRAWCKELFDQLMKGSVNEQISEVRCVRKQGYTFWMQMTVSVVRGRGGRPLRSISILQDITDRKLLEEEQQVLADASELLGTLDYQTNLSNLARLLVPKLADWSTVDVVNETGGLKRLAVAHVDPDKVRWAREIELRYPSDPNAAAGLYQVMRTGKAELYAEVTDDLVRMTAQDADHLEILRTLGMKSVMLVPLKVHGKVFGTLSFISSDPIRRYSERDLEFASELGRRAAMAIDNAKLYNDAVVANRMKDEFLATLSHELRTPLNSIIGWSEIIRNEEVDADERTQAIDIIYRSARTQVQLIDDLLDVSRVITGKFRIEARPTPLDSLLAEVIASFGFAAQAKEIKVSHVVDPQANLILGDPDRIKQVFWNLLSNAIKFTRVGGWVSVTTRKVDNRIQVAVADSGEGIATDFLPHVFDRFRQQDSTMTRRYGGLGLGLAIVRHIVELHGGSVAVTSAGPGQGSVFTVTLPTPQMNVTDAVSPHLWQPSVPRMAPSSEAAQLLGGVRVLVVDDDEGSRRLAERVLKKSGAEVILADSAVDALAKTETYRPNIILSDLGMPEIDGFELLRLIRSLPNQAVARTPAIAMTAYVREEERSEALKAGFIAHLGKPVEPSILVRSVADVMSNV